MSNHKTPDIIWEVKDKIRFQGERRRAEVTAHLLKSQHGDSILDVGCGEGFQISYVTQRSLLVVGIDLSIERLKEAKRRLRHPSFVCASSEKLPFKPQTFNKVMCLELLEHLKNPSETLREIEFLLKEDGILIVSVPYKETIVATQCIHCGKLTPLWGHVQSFDEQKLTSIFPVTLKITQCICTGTIVGAYPLLSFLPTGIWKLIDNSSKILPGVKPSWLIAKSKKTRESLKLL